MRPAEISSQWANPTLPTAPRKSMTPWKDTPQTMNTIWRRITIDTEDGSLYVSFWNSSDDYAVMTKDEFEDYLQNTEMMMGGM